MEIEIRAKIKDIKNVEQCLVGLGAKLVKQKKQNDKYFGEINLFKKLGYSFLMRVRNEGDRKFNLQGRGGKKRWNLGRIRI
jgi:adenylate cyclase class IV